MSTETMDAQLVVIEPGTALTVFTSDNGIDPYLQKIEEEALKLSEGLDPSVAKDRKAIISAAFKVTQSKTIMDKAGKSLKDGLMKDIKPIDPNRKKARDFCEDLADRIRKPVTDWEEAEQNRLDLIKDAIVNIESLGLIVNLEDLSSKTLSELKSSLDTVMGIEANESFEGFQEEAQLQRYKSIESLTNQIAIEEAAEAEKVKQDKIDAENAEKEKADNEERLRQEGAEIARKAEVKKAEVKAEKVKKDKAEAKEREDKAIQDAKDAEARVEQAAIDAENAKVAAEAKRVQDVADAEQLVKDNIAIEAAEVESAKKAREANTRHRTTINNKALKDLTKIEGVTDEMAKAIVIAIAKFEVSNISISY